MSLTSARVGVGLDIIDSSILVATITGLPSCQHTEMTLFCINGTSSTGSSAPRSPLATIAPSDASRMSSRLRTLSAVSILLRTSALQPRLLSSRLSSRTASPSRTKERAKKSTFSRMPNSISSQSFSVIDGSDADLPRTDVFENAES